MLCVRHRLPALLALVLAGLLGPAAWPAGAEDATRACQVTVQNQGGIFVQHRANPIEACLRAILTCREKPVARQTACRARLLVPGDGVCAVGTLDAGAPTLGPGAVAAAVDDTTGTDKLSAALRALVAELDAACFASGDTVDFSTKGLGFVPAPADAVSLAERLNRVPGGLGCLANAEIGNTTPVAASLLAEVTPLDAHCVVADKATSLYTTACAMDKDCGPLTGRCGRLAFALREGPRGLSQCESCPPGRSRTDGACVECAPGLFSGTLEAASCTPCETGHYAAVPGSAMCSTCPVGMYQDREGQPSCVSCVPGRYSDQPGAESCGACAPGSFSDMGATSCTACPPGRFAEDAGSATCAPCAAGEHSNKGAVTCTACEAGRYAAFEGSAECTECARGQFSKAGAVACTACPAGSAANLPGSASCTACSPGNYAPEGAADCLACPEGTVAPFVGSAQCLACGANGRPNPSRTACVCDPGFYVPPDGKAACLPCPTGSACDQRGAVLP